MRNLHWAAIALLASLPSAYMAWTNRDVPHFGAFHDDGLYYASAKSLAERGEYRYEFVPGDPAATKYAPGFAAYLAIAWKINPRFPENLSLAALLMWLSCPVYLFFSALLLRRVAPAVSDQEIAGLVIACGLTPAVGLLSGTLMSEMPFCAMTLCTLWLADRYAGVAGIAGGLSFLFRALGLPLLGTSPLVYVLKRQWKNAALFIAGMLPFVAAWMLWTRLNKVPTDGDVTLFFYFDYLSDWKANVSWDNYPLILWQNAGRLASSAGKLMVFNLGDTSLTNYVSQLMGIASFWGVWRLAARIGWNHWVVYSVGMAVMAVMWSYPPVERFLLPAFPLLLAGFYTLLAGGWRHIRAVIPVSKAADKGVGYVGLALIALVAISWIVLTAEAWTQFLPGYYARYRSLARDKATAYEWIRTNTPPDALWISAHDPVLYLHTGRKGLGFHVPTRFWYAKDRKAAVDFFASLPWPAAWPKASYLLWTADSFETDLSAEEARSVRDRIESNADRVFSSGDAIIYRLR